MKKRCQKKQNWHIFHYALAIPGLGGEVPDAVARELFPPGLLCQCGAFTWQQMNEIERQYTTLEAMWAASS